MKLQFLDPYLITLEPGTDASEVGYPFKVMDDNLDVLIDKALISIYVTGSVGYPQYNLLLDRNLLDRWTRELFHHVIHEIRSNYSSQKDIRLIFTTSSMEEYTLPLRGEFTESINGYILDL